MKTLAIVTVKELKAEAKSLGIKGYSRMTKADLITALDKAYKAEAASGKYPINPLDDPEVQALDVSDEALMSPEKDLEEMSVKELVIKAKNLGINACSQMTKTALIRAIEVFETENSTTEKPVTETEAERPTVGYKSASWDNIVRTLAKEYVLQSKDREYVYENVSKKLGNSPIWRLFYKNTKSTIVPKGDYMVIGSRFFAATRKVIKDHGGDPDAVRTVADKKVTDLWRCISAMVARGLLNYKEVKGNKNETNTVFYATPDQMNAMWKLSK